MTRVILVPEVRHPSCPDLSIRDPLHLAQAALRLDPSYQLPPLATGMMWSTVVAMPLQPLALIWQM